MKKIFFVGFITITFVLCCSACTTKRQLNEKVDSVEEDQSSIDKLELQPDSLSPSTEKKAINYQGELTSIGGIVCGDNLLLWGYEKDGKNALHIMEYGSATSEKVDIEIPQGMILTNISVDNEKAIHVLLVSDTEDNRSYVLWKITTEGKLLQNLDISKDMQDISQRGGILGIPEGMAIDGEGNYYFDTLSGTELVRVFSKTGEFLYNITAENSNIDPNGIYAIESMTCGKNGKIYAILAQAKTSQVRLIMINQTNGYLESVAENILPDMHGRYNCISQGIDCDLLIASIGNGAYAYNIGDSMAEERIVAQEYPCNMENVRMCFLQDGRLLITDFTADNKTFYYLPTSNL